MTHAWTLRIAALMLCFAGLAADVSAQTITDNRVWFNLTLQDKPKAASPWHWTFETILRSRDGVEELDQVAFRPTLMYNFTASSSVGGGYLIGRSDPALGPNIIENRIYAQYMWRGSMTGGTLTLRTRMEGRFIVDDTNGVARLRQQVRFSHPIKAGSRISIVGYDELFIHLNGSNRYKQGIDHNRAFAGIMDTLSPTFRLEIGYLNQYIPGHGALDKMNHVLSVTTAVSF